MPRSGIHFKNMSQEMEQQGLRNKYFVHIIALKDIPGYSAAIYMYDYSTFAKKLGHVI